MISFLIGILSGCSHTTSTHTIQKDLSKDQIIEINYDDVLKKINQKEDFVLYIGRPDCKDCQEFEPYLKKYFPHIGIKTINEHINTVSRCFIRLYLFSV